MIRAELTLEAPGLNGIGEEAFQALRAPARNAVDDAVAHLERAIVANVNGRGPSMPGEFPARDSGEYAASWSHDTEDSASQVEGQVGSSMWDTLGIWLEHGTRKMAPRPHVVPTIEEERAAIERRLGEM